MHPRTFRQVLGRRAEDEALAFFVSRGFSFVDRHWTCRAGELDLVLERGSRLHFIEVKARASCQQHPFEAIPFRKRHRLALAISAWLQAHPEAASLPYQVDAYCLWRDQAGHWQRAHLEGI